MKIKKGDMFLCIKKVKMSGTKEITYKKGYIYRSEIDCCITNEKLNTSHCWDKEAKKHFVKIKGKKINNQLNK